MNRILQHFTQCEKSSEVQIGYIKVQLHNVECIHNDMNKSMKLYTRFHPNRLRFTQILPQDKIRWA
jgi:hypothetical protein